MSTSAPRGTPSPRRPHASHPIRQRQPEPPPVRHVTPHDIVTDIAARFVYGGTAFMARSRHQSQHPS